MVGFWIRISFYLLAIAGISWLMGAIGGPHAGLITALALLGTWVVYQVHHLQKTMRWLEDFRLETVPHGSGTWDLLYAKIYRLARTGEQQREALAETLRDFQSATEAMPDGVVRLDEDHQLIYANEQAEEQLGLSNQKDAGRNLINIVRHPDFVSYLNAGQWDRSVVLRGVRGSDRVLQAQIIPYGTRQRLLMTRDITQIDRLETMRRDFVANVSHELKTPLTVLGGFLETLRELPLSETQRREYLGLMHAQARRMEVIVDDLLVLSQLESSASPSQEDSIEIQPLMERMCAEARTLSRGQHEIVCQSQGGGHLVGAEEELASALTNLVSNAVRYTPPGGRIEIRWTTEPAGGGVFSVSDTGPGIEAQHLPRLTERFYRVDRSRSRETGGTGLGLAIVKHVATRHQAQLIIESEVGKGSRFAIAFPAKRLR